MNLQDFNTLAEAQEHAQVSDKKQVGSGQARGYLVGIGIWKALRTIRADLEHPLSDLADAVIITAADASSFFGLDSETAEGQGNIASIGVFVDAGILTPAQADTFLGLALSKTYPYANTTQVEFDEAKDTGEEKVLPSNSTQYTATINIITQPLKPIDIVVEQRFSKDGVDWTEWHSVGAFRNVYYPQRSYEASVPKSPAAFRELRAVSPLTLGCEVV